MSWRSNAQANDCLSDLIGAIYDCSIDPRRWRATIEKICVELNCVSSSVISVELLGSDAEKDRIPATLKPTVAKPSVPDRRLDISHYAALARPAGACGSILGTVLRDERCIEALAFHQCESGVEAKDREIAILRLLIPHIRRAVAVGNLLDCAALKKMSLTGALDAIANGVVAVGCNGQVIHANSMARAMFARGGPVTWERGRLSACDHELAKDLHNAIANTAKGGVAGVGAGFGVPLRCSSGEAAIAHVLPLAGEAAQPQAAAVVFISTAGERRPAPDLGAFARHFGVTPGERRCLERIAAGVAVGEAARVLEISEATARTHLKRIFIKTGALGQTDLIAMVQQLTPPIYNYFKD